MSQQPPEPKIARSRFDTRALPRTVASDAWNEAINVIFDARTRQRVDDGFHARVDAALLGEVALGRLAATAQDFDRSRYKIARDGMDGYLLQFYLRGQSARRSGSNSHVAGEGDLYVIDMAQPLATSTSDHEQLTLVVPRRLLAPQLDQPDGVHMRVVPATMPLVSLFRDSLKSFYGQIDAMSCRDGEAAVPPLLGLAAAAINGHVDERGIADVQTARFAAIRRHVEAHLLDPGLSLDGLLGSFGLSRRQAYRLFEAVGGFATYVSRRRLQRSLTALRSPDWRHLSIAEVAAAHGFDNPGSFSRAFRREFGLSPRAVRQLSAAGVHMPQAAGLAEANWSQWISVIGR